MQQGAALARSSRPAGGPESEAGKPVRSQTLLRGFDIIDAVLPRPLTIPEIAAQLGLSYPTAHRLVSVLAEQRYLRAIDGRHFGLGPRLIQLGFAAHAAMELVQLAREPMEQLVEATGDTVHLAQREGAEAVYIGKLSGSRWVEIATRIGGRRPLLTTGVGKALLLDDSDAALAVLLDRQADLVPGGKARDAWMANMLRYRAGGYAFDLGEEEAVLRCVAAPVRDAAGRILAALSVTSTIDYTDDARQQALVPVVQRAARELSVRLGYRPAVER